MIASKKYNNWENFYSTIYNALASFVASDSSKNIINHEDFFSKLISITEEMKNNKGTLYLCGNGASSSLCSHFSVDLSKNAEIKTHIFTDAAWITAVSNDINFECVFSEYIYKHANKNDILLAISSSGNSKNIVSAIESAKQTNMKIVTLSAMDKNNHIRHLGNLNAFVNVNTYGLAETAHAAILHHWTDCMITAKLQEDEGHNENG